MKILVIDDEPLVRRSISRVFLSSGHQVLEASEGLSGLDVWRRERPDLVFLDILMPGLTGPQVLGELEPELKSKTKVILISAYSGEHNLETAERLGANCFIPKPFDDIFSLVQRAEELVSHG